MNETALLCEIGTEEMPAWVLDDAARQFARELESALAAERLAARLDAVWYTPRRLAVLLAGLPGRQQELVETTVGPPARVAFDEAGGLTQAALAFAKKHGVDPSRLRSVPTPKGDYLAFERRVPGEKTEKILQRVLPDAIARIQFPKTMYWTADKFRFARPIRWIVALCGRRVVRFEIAGVRSSRRSCGHRFLGKPRIRIPAPESFRDLLAQGGVIVDPEERRTRIVEGLARAASGVGGRLLEDPALVDTVVNLNECPSVIRGSFAERFLALPDEILVTVMREHQKYFAVLDGQGRLLPHFLAVINMPSDPDGDIRAGHERVLHARLADAEFFWNVDRKRPLLEREAQLKNVLYQEKLGTYYDKTQRVLALLPRTAEACGLADRLADLQTAARLMKCDLVTEMVKEFPDLQGVVGGLYARAEGYPEEIWRAVYEQYRPAATNSPSPATACGAVLSLTDRLDTVCGCFSIGLVPSGSRDPFALRRQGNAVLKIILDHRFKVSLARSIGWSLEILGVKNDELIEEIAKFLEARLRFLLSEQGYAADCINAAFAAGCDDPLDALERVRALQGIRPQADFMALASSFKRISNILARAGAAGAKPDSSLMQEPAELALWRLYLELEPVVAAAREGRAYDRALRALAGMRAAVDRFFDEVLVMAEDPAVRANRLALLERLASLFLGIADISQISPEQAA